MGLKSGWRSRRGGRCICPIRFSATSAAMGLSAGGSRWQAVLLGRNNYRRDPAWWSAFSGTGPSIRAAFSKLPTWRRCGICLSSILSRTICTRSPRQLACPHPASTWDCAAWVIGKTHQYYLSNFKSNATRTNSDFEDWGLVQISTIYMRSSMWRDWQALSIR